MCYSSTTLSAASATPPRRQQHPYTTVDDFPTSTAISTPSAESPGVPCLGSFELLTWATTGSARDLGDRSERGSGAGAPTPATG